MKKTLLICLVAVLFYGCSKKDDAKQSGIVGTWMLYKDVDISFEDSGAIDTIENYVSSISQQFNSNGTGVYTYLNYLNKSIPQSWHFTYTLSNQTLICTYPPQNNEKFGSKDTTHVSVVTATQLQVDIISPDHPTYHESYFYERVK